jgi:hypothetical protein
MRYLALALLLLIGPVAAAPVTATLAWTHASQSSSPPFTHDGDPVWFEVCVVPRTSGCDWNNPQVTVHAAASTAVTATDDTVYLFNVRACHAPDAVTTCSVPATPLVKRLAKPVISTP